MKAELDHITSASNPSVKRLRSLERKKGRNETGLFLAEGARLIEQALAQSWSVDTLVVSNSGIERDYVQDLAERAAAQGARLIQVPDRLAGSEAGRASRDSSFCLMAAITDLSLIHI